MRPGASGAAGPPDVRAAMAGDRAALAAYGGGDMVDPTLGDRLPVIDVPVLVVRGAADRVGTFADLR